MVKQSIAVLPNVLQLLLANKSTAHLADGAPIKLECSNLVHEILIHTNTGSTAQQAPRTCTMAQRSTATLVLPSRLWKTPRFIACRRLPLSQYSITTMLQVARLRSSSGSSRLKRT
jgi:hypothetical protein